ncbi:feruloyl esterase [Herbihabitans rhizosphaerae]|uniref:Feruloyl esterase n=1 Tax=Herbihabitans rhizosphaerae TaxID=1872711 RepID=A0A4Q7KL97_9PSEU|nr:tannase/feruloyl esterase family alpha/beta hydrolase [Herbihabitans rhizosphaerae]RZS37014.1 feruloyl esterase [Herbihabitans rhizosphaerae]
MRTSLRHKASAVLGALAMAVLGVAAAPPAAAADTPSAVKPVRGCAELNGTTLDLPGARTHVTEAAVVHPPTEPEYCDVRGYVEPAVKFQLKLPTTTYSGRYLQYGCGGFCGLIFPPAFPDCGPPAADMAVAATDDGHVGDPPELAPMDGRWAADNQPARDDFAFRAPHVLSRASKALIATFYGKPPKQSYFNGCSTGGREALLLAQRYPDDFDGIIAAAPANHMSALVGYQAWLAKANEGPNGTPLLTAEKLTSLHNAVVPACDKLDGLVDGQLDEPRLCTVDPSVIQCPQGTDGPGCLTPAQVAAARKLYAGPTDEHGRRLYPGWAAHGSELALINWILPFPGSDLTAANALADNYLKYMGYPVGTPHSSLAQHEFTTRALHRLTPEGLRADAMSTDLSKFRRSGGKLILWHGWADEGIPAHGTIDYYERVTRRHGGLAKTQEFARLFMVPTMHHCSDGYRLTDVDPIKELVAWTEKGTAPDKVIANQTDETGKVLRSRPVFAYPKLAAYDGSGSIDDAANFVPAQPLVRTEIIRWAGEYMYHLPGPTAP